MQMVKYTFFCKIIAHVIESLNWFHFKDQYTRSAYTL